MKELNDLLKLKYRRGVDAQDNLDRLNGNVKRKYKKDILPLVNAYMGMFNEGTEEYEEAKANIRKKMRWNEEHTNKIIKGLIPIETYVGDGKFEKVYE